MQTSHQVPAYVTLAASYLESAKRGSRGDARCAAIMSLLSDAQERVARGIGDTTIAYLNAAKYLTDLIDSYARAEEYRTAVSQAQHALTEALVDYLPPTEIDKLQKSLMRYHEALTSTVRHIHETEALLDKTP